ncbi:ABC transporter permease [Acidobacterium sp. S8]|uniref:ABC transporter permease n=1 Tax=Acidobacterium sp. S8 TaxID=1641854 RepID=UPI00131DB057|nr:ABC transporter permease [Acidobacterium sp. S8]
MRFIEYLRSLSSTLLRRGRINGEMEEELRSHVQHRADDLERSGMPRAEAKRRAQIEFGGHERYRQESHESLAGNYLETFSQDVRHSVRVLWKSPGFTAVAVFTLALGIGANAVVFSVMNALILRPLNVPNPQSLYMLEKGKDNVPMQSYPDYADLRDRNRNFDGIAAYSMYPAGLNTGKNPSTVWIYEASGNYFDVLGIQPYLGRFFHRADEHGPNSAPYVVISFNYWRSHFQGDAGVVGRVVQLNKHPFTILGVAPPKFRGTELFFSPDLWAEMMNQEQVEGWNALTERGARSICLIGRLKAGITPTQAVADLNSIGADLAKTYPKDDADETFALTRPGLVGDMLGRPVRAFVTGLMLLAGLILLAACANLGSLFAARAADRAREIALRLALGSSRKRVLRQLLTEAVIIALTGGAAGVVGGVVILRWLSTWQPVPNMPINVPVNPDAAVYVVALVLALISGLLFGIVPVRQVLRANPYQIVKAGSASGAGRRFTGRDLLLIVQITICAVLVTSSLVAVRGLVRSLHSNFGFQPQNAMVVDSDLGMAGYSGDGTQVMQKRMIQAMQAIPGVSSAGMIERPPLAMGWSTSMVFKDTTTDFRVSNAAAESMIYRVSPEYFQAAGTALLRGSTFTWHDDKDSPRVAVVNREFARRIFGSEASALGGYYKTVEGTRIHIVGIVEDGKYKTLTEDPQPAMFYPILQSPTSASWLIIRSNRDPHQLAITMEKTLRGLDPGLPFTIRTWSRELDSALFGSRVATIALGVLGALGAMLAVTGIFGMAAYSVSKRLRELGIRVALGAQRSEVLGAALGRAFRLLALGSIAGLLLGMAASKVLASVVYEATPRDPLVLGGVVLIMLLLGLLATWIPAQRALSADPLMLLREE